MYQQKTCFSVDCALIGVAVKRVREYRGMRAVELSRKTGLTPQEISKIEHGKNIGERKLSQLLDGLGYPTIHDALADAKTIPEDVPAYKLGFIVEAQRASLGLSLNELSKMAGVSQRVIATLEDGREVLPCSKTRIMRALAIASPEGGADGAEMVQNTRESWRSAVDASRVGKGFSRE